MIQGADGKLVSTAAVQRLLPPSLRRFVDNSAPGCEWPGCGRTVGLFHFHHIERFNGKNTVAEKVAKLCWVHHVLAHEGGWKLLGTRTEGFRVLRPDGDEIAPRPTVTWEDARLVLREVARKLRRPPPEAA